MTSTTAFDNRQTVAAIYEAFGRGDVPAILATLAPEVAWEKFPQPTAAQDAGVEHLRERRNPAEVGDFFASLADLDITEFEPHTIVADGTHVIARVNITLTVKATGRTHRDDELHWWEFGDDGTVKAFRHYVDTARRIWAHESD